jgi:hypothetical protein
MFPIEGDAFRETSRCGATASVSFLARLWPFQAHRVETERANELFAAQPRARQRRRFAATTVDSSRAGPFSGYFRRFGVPFMMMV